LFDVASGEGYDCAYEPVTAVDLFAAQGVWLVSSMTLAARVHTLDGRALSTDVLAREFGALVDAAVSG
jgi:4-amino-4-deoxychorismate lyase